jgi:hypothetical protein
MGLHDILTPLDRWLDGCGVVCNLLLFESWLQITTWKAIDPIFLHNQNLDPQVLWICYRPIWTLFSPYMGSGFPGGCAALLTSFDSSRLESQQHYLGLLFASFLLSTTCRWSRIDLLLPRLSTSYVQTCSTRVSCYLASSTLSWSLLPILVWSVNNPLACTAFILMQGSISRKPALLDPPTTSIVPYITCMARGNCYLRVERMVMKTHFGKSNTVEEDGRYN